MKKVDKKEIAIIALIILIQTVVFVIAGANKSYIHMDEAYSLGLASYDKVEIQANEDFYDTWHTKEYYEDYLTVNEDEKGEFLQVYENQKNDVHPPLYYLLLRIAMGFHKDSFSMWPGIIVNIIIYIFITIFMYLILKKLLSNENKHKEKSAILALISSITLASITNAIYIRMYALATLNIVITTYLHLKLLDKNDLKLFIGIGIMALLGSLTHYYYLFYLAMLFVMFVIKYIKEKDYKNLGKYVGTFVIAAALSLLIFPYSIKHMFFGYRGQGVISNLTNISKFIGNIAQYILKINLFGFNNLLFAILIAMIVIFIYKKVKKIKSEPNSKYMKYICIPTLFYFILVSIASPWIELRYVMPICSIVFIIVILHMAKMLKSIVKEKTLNRIIGAVLLIMLIMPMLSNLVIDISVGSQFRNQRESLFTSKAELTEVLKDELNVPVELIAKFSDAPLNNLLLLIKNFKIEPEVLYSNKKIIMEVVKNNQNLPTLYSFNSNNNRFLDDILLFANINESYIAKDVEFNEEKVKEIMANKDISKGMLVFINEGQENDELLEVIKNAMDLNKITYLQRLNACDVYYVF